MAPIEPAPDGLDAIVVNNRIRGALDTAIGALKLLSPDRSGAAHASAKAIEATSQAALLPLIEKAIARGKRPWNQEFAATDQGGAGPESSDLESAGAVRALGGQQSGAGQDAPACASGKDASGNVIEPTRSACGGRNSRSVRSRTGC